MLKKALAVSFALYLFGLLTSMFAVEFFGWLTFTLAMAMNFREIHAGRQSWKQAFFTLGADAPVLALVVVVVLGYFINTTPGAKPALIFGGVRFAAMMYGLVYALRWLGFKDRLFAPFMIVAAIVSLHGIQEYFTGWDYIRHRAVVRMIEGVQGKDVRACGFFAMPTTFGNAICMTICFPVAAGLMHWFDKRPGKKVWENIAVITGGSLLLVGIGLSFTRAAWIALFIALVVMACYKGFRSLLITLVAITLVSGVFFAAKPDFLMRAQTIFDLSYHSNTGRLQMWQTNLWMVQDYPILGVGLNDNERRGPEYNQKHGVTDVHLGNAHNTYLQFLAGTGVLGLTAYLCFIGFYLWLTYALLRLVPPEQIWHRTFVLGALGAQVAMHVVGLMDCNFKSMQVQHQYIAVLAGLSYLRYIYILEPRQKLAQSKVAL